MGVRERYEQRQKEGKSSDYSGVKQRYMAKEIENVGSSITNRVNTWLKNHNTYISNYQTRNSGRKYNYEDSYMSDSADWLNTVSQQKSAFDAEADSILSYMDQYKDYLDADWMSSVRKTLTDARGAQDIVLGNTRKDNEWWSSFGSEEMLKAHGSAEEAYKANQRYDGYSKKYSGQKYEDIQKAMKTFETNRSNEISAMESDLGLYKELSRWEQDELGTAKLQQLRQKYGSIDDLEKSIYEKKMAAPSEEEQWLTYYQDELYKGDSTYNSKAASGWKSYEAQKIADAEQKEDRSWLEDLDKIYSYASSDSSLPTGILSDVQAVYRNDTSYREPNDEWSTEQKNRFGYLWTEDKQKAYAYAEQVNNQINAKKKYDQQQAIGAAASDNFWSGAGHTLGAIATAPMGIVDYLNDIAEYTARGTITQKEFISPFEYSQAVQSGIANKLNGVDENGVAQNVLDENIPIFGGKGWGDIYSLGVSTANSMLSALAFGGAGTLVNFIGQGGAAGVDDALSRGATAEQALMYGTILGSLEGLTEMIPAEQLIKAGSSATFKNWLKKALQQGVGEFFEEGSSSFFGNLADDIIMRDKSNYNLMVKQLMQSNPGMTAEEASKIAFKQMAGDIAYDAIGGAVSGFASGGITGAVATAIDSSNLLNKENVKAKQQYGGSTDALIQEGLQNNPNSESYQLAQKYQKQVEGKKSKDGKEVKKGKELSGFQIRNLLAANQEQTVEQTKSRAKDRLKELGENASEIYKIADIVTKKVYGQELTRSEKSTLANSFGSQVAKEIDDSRKLAAELIKRAREASTAHKSLTDRVGEESNLSVSESGQTMVRETGEAFDIKKAEVATLTDGRLTFKTADGNEVSAEDIDWADEDTAYLVSAVSRIENITPGDATVLIHNYDASSDMSVGEYVNGIDEAFTYGYNNYSVEDMKAGRFTTKLSDQQMMSAYQLGKTERSVSKTAKADAIKKMRTAVDAEVEKLIAEGKTVSKGKMTITYNAGNGNVVDFDKAGVKLSTKQKAAPALAKVMHEMGLGTNFELFSSYLSKTMKDEDGNRVRVFLNENGEEEVAYSGVYMAKNGKIRIDLNAYNGRGLTLDAMSHELTHFIQLWSEEKYDVLADFLVKTYGEKTDMSMHQRVLREQARLERIRKKDVSYSEAYDEVVANAMSKMLADGKVMERLNELKAQDMDLAQKLWEGLKKLLKKFFRAYEKESALFYDAADLMELKEEFEQMQKMWAEAFVEASENFQSNLMATEVGVEPVAVEDISRYSYSSLAEAAGFVAVQNEDGTRSFTRDGNKVSEVTVEDIDNSPIGAFINFSVEMKDISEADAKRQKQMFADICTMACKTKDFAMTMQFVGSAVFTGMKANADKQYGTTYDFPSICTKTQAVIDAMSAKMMKLGRGLNTNEIVQLYDDVFASGNPVPCPECYVFSRWIGIGGLLDNIKKYQDYYGDMDVKDVADAYLKMKAEVSKFAEEQKISFGKAKGAMTSKFTKEFNNLTEKIEKQENQGEKVKPSDRKRLAELEPMMNTVKAMTWLENVYFADSSLKKVNPKFRVPNEVLFDLNNGEAFATQYKEAWAFRTTQGAGYGKAITPYAEARLGEGVLVTNNTTNAIKGRAQGTLNNYFLQQKGKLDKQSRDALKRARIKQKIQAFIGGQRFQSTSDARYENASDYLLAALEMQAMGGMVQCYTKVDGAIPAFSAWGFSSNQSLMPLNGGLDADGNVQDTPVGGMKPSVAFENRKKHESAGTITIGVNDNHIRAMFKQWVRDFIIPYHASGGKADVVAEFRRIQEGKKENEGETVRSTDYSRTQSDKVLSDDVLRWQGKTDAQIQRIHEVRAARIAILTGGKPNMTVVRSNRFLSALYDKFNGGEWDGVKVAKSKVESQIFPNEFWDQTVSYDESAKITKDYLEYCEDLGFLHRFSGTVPSNGMLVPVRGYDQNGNRVQLTDLAYKYDENGNKTDEVEEFFWKVLTDRRMYDNNRNYLPQKVVTLNDTTAETVTGFAKNNQGRQYDKAKAEALAQKIVKGERYSSQETDRDYLNAVNRGDMETAQRMVYEAAKAAGYTTKGFHGSGSAGFTVVDRYSMLWFARDEAVARGYGADENVEGGEPYDEYGVYAMVYNLGKNLVIEADGASWGELPVTEDEYPGVYVDEDTGDITTNAMAEWAERHGYDSITFKNVDDGGYTTVDVVFNPTRDAKSSVPVTYDNKGNVIPLSKRFDKTNDDLRYSSQETDADYIKYDRKAILKESKVDEYLYDYAAKSSPKYAQAYISYVRPRTFLKLTTDDMLERYHIADQAGELDAERLSNSRPGIYLRIDHETGQVTGHEGRHRMSAMDGAGIELVPVLLLDTSNKMTKTDIAEITLHGQFDETAMGVVRDLIPLNYENRDRVVKNFATQSSAQRIGERYGLNKTLRFSGHETDDVSNRHLLANAFEGLSRSSAEYKMIQDYKEQINVLNLLDEQLSDLNAEIREIRFTKGKYDAEKLRKIEEKAERIARDIDKQDKVLIRMEASEPLRKIIAFERKKAAQKTKDHVNEIQQNKKVRAEQTELRHKIRKTIRDLDKILNRGNKKLNVKEDVQNVVTKALQAADILFTDNYGTYDMLRNGIGADLSDSEEALVKTCTRMLKDLDKMPTDGYDNFQARQEAENKLKTKMSKLNEVFARERKRLNNTTVSSILGELADAYASLEKSDQSYVQGAYTEAVHNFLKSLQSEVGGTIVKDMTKDQLEYVYAAYKMVLTTVRKANQMFNEELKMSREQLGNAVIQEVMNAGGVHGLWTKAELAVSKADWNNMKPIWVANRIGSETFGKLMHGLFEGQYNFAVDVEEAKQFKLSMDEKYKPRSWDAEKQYEFESSTGKKFSLNLQQIMSLYAFSKREQAYSHLLNGGFVFEGNSTVIVDEKGRKKTYIHNGATSYKLNDATLNEIISSLTKEQKAYVDEMQKYLSEVMGAKGNEVSMQLYGIKMFKEQFYFPLRSSGAYMERAKEAEMKKQQGQINLVNSGFTHAVKPEAKNPIILSGFMDVWAEHCNEMSMYHSMVLPMEDFRKVYNYSTVHNDEVDSASVFQTIQDAYGDAATAYIDQLYRELNAGATIDPRETTFKKLISNFKKTAVMLSASVVVQQFSSIGRAYALIDPKYFIGTRVNSDTQLSVADEMKKYAPVAIIKEMGGFDTGTKGSAKSYIMAEKYGKGEWLQGLKKDEQYRSDLMGILPAKADEKTWCAIWEAVKRETKAKHPKMDVKSEEFLKLAGERFSEVIEKTQVYDSVLARSANMRSKTGLMQMATSFMAEPTTTVNLLEDAIRRGDKKHMARAFGAVAVSIVLNNALASIVYAMRDDDEDETFIEKYFQSFTSGMIDDINPMSYYPFLKDVYSLFQGYDVERADMSVIADLRDALKKAISLIGKDTSGMDDDELAKHYKTVNSAILSLLDAGCSVFGVPLKNVRRDANGIINAWNTVGKDLTERDTSWNSFWDKVGAAAKDTIPIYAWTKDEAKADKIYDAIVSGDKAYLARLKSTYKTDSAYQSAVRKALRENDSRIHEAAQAKYDGKTEEYKRIFRQIQKEGKFSFDDIMSAVNSEENAIRNGLEPEKVTSSYTASGFVEAVILGDSKSAAAMREDIISTKVANGKTQEEAEKEFTSAVATGIHDAYSSGLLDEAGAENMLMEYAGKDEEEAASKVNYWAFCDAHPQYELTESNVTDYQEFAEPAEISLDVFVQYINGTKGLADIKDKWGDVEVTKREQVLEVIDSLPLTWQQKDALYLAAGYSESKIWDVPW